MPLLPWPSPRVPRGPSFMSVVDLDTKTEYGLRRGAEEFPLMVVISVIYPCNLGCPFNPYTDGNSELRMFYHDYGGDLLPVPLWEKMADENKPNKTKKQNTGGGE